MPAKLENLIAVGIDSALAAKAIDNGFALSKLKAASKQDLMASFSEEEAALLWDAARRKPIEKETIRRLVEENDWKCCVCWDIKREEPVIVHHIEEHSKTQDDSYDNLVVLCLKHHADVHTKHELSRHPLPPELLHQRKQQWAEAVRGFKAGLRPAPGHEPDPLPAVPSAPRPPAPFVGRRDKLDDLSAAIVANPAVSIALQGMAGAGKTATAKQLACELATHLPGGVFWASLGDHNGNASPILHNWARLCGREMPQGSDGASLAQMLRGILTAHQSQHGTFLAVADDVREEWREAAELIQKAVPSGTPLVITARHEALALTLASRLCRLDGLPPDEGLLLLKAVSDATLIANEPVAASALLKTVDCLPLAIELAGKCILFRSKKPGFSLAAFQQAVADRAAENLKLPGQPGLASAFSISYEALDVQCQRVFRCLDVFADTPLIKNEVAGVVHADASKTEAVLDSLVAASLLTWGDQEGQYKLHPLLRQYAQVLLNAEGGQDEAQTLKESHLDFYIALAEANSENTVEAHRRLDAALPNILKAVDFAVTTDEPEALNQLGLHLSGGLFFYTRGCFREAQHLLTHAIAACREMNKRLEESVHLITLGSVQSTLGRIDEAEKHFKQALKISQELEVKTNECAVLGNLGLLYQGKGQIDVAILYYQQAYDLALESGNVDAAVDQLGNMGGANRHLGNAEKAGSCYSTALAMSKKIGDKIGEGNNLSNLGLIYFDIGNLETAEKLIYAAAMISQDIGDRKGEANRFGHLGNVHLQLALKALTDREHEKVADHLNQSISFYHDALYVCREIGHRANEVAWLIGLGNIHRMVREPEKAAENYFQAIAIAQEVSDPESEAISLTNLAILHRDAGDISLTKYYSAKALSLLKSTKSRHVTEVEKLLLTSLD